MWKVGEGKRDDEWGKPLRILLQTEVNSFIYWDNMFKNYLYNV